MDLWQTFNFGRDRCALVEDQLGRHSFLLGASRSLQPSLSQELAKRGFTPKYPKGHSFAVCLSHDIDTLFATKRHFLGQCLRALRRGTLSFRDFAALIDRGRSPYNNLNQIGEFLEEYEIKSTFFFLSLERGEEDFDYSLQEIALDLQRLASRGHTIGLHGGHLASSDPKILELELSRLVGVSPKGVRAYRSHYLRHDLDATWLSLEENGLSIDATMGYHDCVGYRNGVCWPYYPYLPSQNRYSSTLCVPLTIMDGSLDTYMHLDLNQCFSFLCELIDKAASLSGVVTLLWHNTAFSGPKFRLLKELLDYCRTKGAWFASMEELSDYWRHQKYGKELQSIVQEFRVEKR